MGARAGLGGRGWWCSRVAGFGGRTVLRQYQAFALWFRYWVAELSRSFKPQIYGLADILKCSLLGVAVGRASRKLGRFGDIYAVFVAPIDDDLVFVH